MAGGLNPVTAQHLIVFPVVLACSGYALWVLMPSALRRVLAAGLGRLPLGSALQAFFQRAARPSTGCDCSGCDAVVDHRPTANARRVIRVHLQSTD